VLALATAVIGAGATLLPAGAASAASARIQQAAQYTARDPIVVTTVATRSLFKGTVVPNGTSSNAYFEYQDAPAPDKPDAPVPRKPDAPIAKVSTSVAIPGDVPIKEVDVAPPGPDAKKTYQARIVAETPAGKRVEGNWLDVTE
jgi:hypothetical protein